MRYIHQIHPGIFMQMALKKGSRKQKKLSKEFVREWLIANGFMGKSGQSVPVMSEEWIQTISNRYIELYEKVIGEEFVPLSYSSDETFLMIMESLSKLKA